MRIASEAELAELAELAWFFKREAPEDKYEMGDLGKKPNVSSRKPID